MTRRETAGRLSFQGALFAGRFLLAALLLAGCAGQPQATSSPGPVPLDPLRPPLLAPGVPPLVRVPGVHATIQAAVDAARPGQVILIAPGVYHEAVRVKTPGITIRGQDRNQVVLDGNFQLPTGIEIEANQVALENLTARHYVGNAFAWEGDTGAPLKGYRGSYLTAYANGGYGFYAFNAVEGQFDHSYATGQADAAFYIGQCFPCNVVIAQVIAEGNAVGYSGTNAGGNLIIRDSLWRNNLLGIEPNSLDLEQHPPEQQAIIFHNRVETTMALQAPSLWFEEPYRGVGIALRGGVGNVVLDNQVIGQPAYGIVLLPSFDQQLWVSAENRILANTITHSGLADLALAAPAGPDNCFSQNAVTSTLPPLLQERAPCDVWWGHLEGGDSGITLTLQARLAYAEGPHFHPRDWRTVPAPPDQPQLPQRAGPALSIFPDLRLFNLPPAAQAPSVDRGALAPRSGAAAVLLLWLGFDTEVIPLALYAAWLAVGLWDLAGNEPGGRRARWAWMVVLVALPLLGPVLYYLLGRSTLARPFRLMLVLGLPLIYLAITGLLEWLAA